MSEKLITIYSGNPIDADIFCQVLEDNGIKASLRNEILGTLVPWQVSGGGADPVDVEVLESDKTKALALLEEFNRNTF